MNKKIKIIELMQKCANKENIPERILYKNTVFVLDDCKNYYNEEEDERLLDYIMPTFTNLNDYVEILEDNTEEIEEILYKLPEYRTSEDYDYRDIKANRILINKLVKVVEKEIRKDKSNDK